ncbi:hypothetical protein JOD67_003571 [Tenggerimyces flavus]|nr:hypothetical protein [Tenggerimyces flavus]
MKVPFIQRGAGRTGHGASRSPRLLGRPFPRASPLLDRPLDRPLDRHHRPSPPAVTAGRRLHPLDGWPPHRLSVTHPDHRSAIPSTLTAGRRHHPTIGWPSPFPPAASRPSVGHPLSHQLRLAHQLAIPFPTSCVSPISWPSSMAQWWADLLLCQRNADCCCSRRFELDCSFASCPAVWCSPWAVAAVDFGGRSGARQGRRSRALRGRRTTSLRDRVAAFDSPRTGHLFFTRRPLPRERVPGGGSFLLGSLAVLALLVGPLLLVARMKPGRSVPPFFE